MTDTASPTPPQPTVIFCARTCNFIDTVPPGQNPDARLRQLLQQYGPDLVLLTPEDALNRYEARFITAPEEITEERFLEMLNILPPVSWTSDHHGESFKIVERLAGRITTIYVRLGTRHFTFSDNIRTPHAECCRRAAASIQKSAP